MKAELGYCVETNPIGEDSDPIRVPIYGLRAVPQEIIDSKWGNPNFGKHHWQVEIFAWGDYVWINQYRARVFLH